MPNTLSPEEMNRLASRVHRWRAATHRECSSRDMSVGYTGEVDDWTGINAVHVEVYWVGGIFRGSYKIFVHSDGFTVGYSLDLDRKKVKKQFDRAEAAYEASLSRATERALEIVRQSLA